MDYIDIQNELKPLTVSAGNVQALLSNSLDNILGAGWPKNPCGEIYFDIYPVLPIHWIECKVRLTSSIKFATDENTGWCKENDNRTEKR
jgi:hypothetical protein